MNWMNKEYKDGLIKGIPIGLGYLPVSFAFGLIAVNGGMSVWMVVLISMSNLTSSGQYAGTNLILACASLFEITLNVFIINLRYMLMSLSLTQKIHKKTSVIHRLIFSFGITDETFAIASMEEKTLTSAFMYGLITCPYIGWALGTLLGACASNVLPEILKGAMGIALFAMFIAIIVPPAKNSRPVLSIILLSISITCIIRFIPLFSFISTGFCTIIATIIASAFGAVFFPISENENKKESIS